MDQIFLQKTLAGWLGQQGYAIQKNEDKADYRISVIVRSLGTELGNSFFRMPPVTSQLIPFSLPELACIRLSIKQATLNSIWISLNCRRVRLYDRRRLSGPDPFQQPYGSAFSLLSTRQISNPPTARLISE